MDTAEVRAMTKLPSTVGSMTEADRVRRQFEASRDAISDDERRILDHLCEHIKPEEDNDEVECDREKRSSQDNSAIDDKGETDPTRFSGPFLPLYIQATIPERE